MHVWLRSAGRVDKPVWREVAARCKRIGAPGRSSPWVETDSEAANRLLALVYLYFECTIDHHDLVPF